ncbi:unnamed protein product [marine sediment metagenome]|uniref:Uncharacterized protein n=1 Tax=marine sediment metagenome TaxID=412755 RepID=X1SN43_9ZZZZ
MSDFSPELDDKLKALGICPLDLKEAIIWIRDFRIQVVKAGVDPKATRIALLFAEIADREFAEKTLTAAEMKELQQIAQGLYELVKGEH